VATEMVGCSAPTLCEFLQPSSATLAPLAVSTAPAWQCSPAEPDLTLHWCCRKGHAQQHIACELPGSTPDWRLARSKVVLATEVVPVGLRRYQDFAQRGPSDEVAPRGTAGNPLYDAASPRPTASPQASPPLAAIQAAVHRNSEAQPAADSLPAQAEVGQTLSQSGAQPEAVQPDSWASMSHSQLVEHCLRSARAEVRRSNIASGSAAEPLQSGSAADATVPPLDGHRADAQCISEARKQPDAGRPPEQLPSPATSGVTAAISTDSNAAASTSHGQPVTHDAAPPSPTGAPPGPEVPGAGCLRTSPGGLSDSVCSSRHVALASNVTKLIGTQMVHAPCYGPSCVAVSDPQPHEEHNPKGHIQLSQPCRHPEIVFH